MCVCVCVCVREREIDRHVAVVRIKFNYPGFCLRFE